MATFTRTVFLCTLLAFLSSTHSFPSGCYKSIISFGDSLADTGNLLALSPLDDPPHFALPPYGKSYFGQPTGRLSDGRVVLDFIAEGLGLPLASPYLEEKISNRRGFYEGVNFAVAGAKALEDSFFDERGIENYYRNVSLKNQLDWFREMMAYLCQDDSGSDCKEYLRSSLIVMGEIGGDDYNHPLMQGIPLEEVQSFVPIVVRSIASAIDELIGFGAETIIVPGNLPIGCSAVYLTSFQSSNKKDYDPFGCLKWLNNLSKYHNKMLQNELNRLRRIHPRANIIYADYYNAASPIYHFPNKFGFRRTLAACCGGGGPYNYNPSVACGFPPTTCCDNPSTYICWDGLHMTEAANRLIAQGLLHGPYANPPLSAICTISPESLDNRQFV